MDRLSEEEIIDKVMMIEQWKVSGDIYTQNELNAIGELLDLYNKEKNKNKKLDRESKVKQTSDEFTEETRYYTPEGEIYETIIKTYKCPKNYISKDKIRTLLHSYAIDDENLKKYLEKMLEEEQV